MSRRAASRVLVALASGLGLGCGSDAATARDQWTVQLSSDAPLPEFGDRLELDVLDEHGELACDGCRRLVGVGADTAWPISFGIVAERKGLMARARLFRSDYTGADGAPSGAAMIEAGGLLPPARGDTRVGLSLAMSCFGVAASVAEGRFCDPEQASLGPPNELPEGELPPSELWPPARAKPCAGDIPDGMVCVPGGVFLMGAPKFVHLGPDLDPSPEHLVQLSPFALDLDEVTVGVVRDLLLFKSIPRSPVVNSGIPGAKEEGCTYPGNGVSTNDAMPVNCVSLGLAQATCRALGKRLPTEAEWEYAAGNLGLETTYPWGDDDTNPCSLATVGLGRGLTGEASSCRRTGTGETKDWGPVAGGAAQDRTLLGIRNLGGNLTEWVADMPAPYSSACWIGAAPLRDPLCQLTDASHQSLRGGSWQTNLHPSQAFVRNSVGSDAVQNDIGFRCALSR